MKELRAFAAYVRDSSSSASLRSLNLLGMQFALCECSKYFFYLECGSGHVYKPRSYRVPAAVVEVSSDALAAMASLWHFVAQPLL